MKVIVKAPAKIDLSLDVMGKRPDGYHEVNMVMTTVDLSDHVECEEFKDDQIIVSSTALYVPEDDRNLAYKAADLVKRKFQITKGIKIDIDKQIPVAAGLAGGSSDAAVTIRALNKLWKLNLSVNEMMALGAEVGSDVAFCIYGGTAKATGRGEKIEPLPSAPPCWVVLAKPPISASTRAIYGALNLEGVVDAIKDGDYHGMCAQLGNSLERVTMESIPETQRIKTLIGKWVPTVF